MSRLPLVEEHELSGYVKELHDGAAAEDWSTRHVARVFATHPGFIEDYLAFYYPWHSSSADASVLPARLKELVRLRIGDEDIAQLRRHFNEAETLELMMMAGQYIGFGRVLAVLALETTSCPIP